MRGVADGPHEIAVRCESDNQHVVAIVVKLVVVVAARRERRFHRERARTAPARAAQPSQELAKRVVVVAIEVRVAARARRLRACWLRKEVTPLALGWVGSALA